MTRPEGVVSPVVSTGHGCAYCIPRRYPLPPTLRHSVCCHRVGSRVAKLVQLYLAPDGVISSAVIRCCLLESSRCVAAPRGERNFHVFHQLCVGASLDRKKSLQLGVRDHDGVRPTSTAVSMIGR